VRALVAGLAAGLAAAMAVPASADSRPPTIPALREWTAAEGAFVLRPEGRVVIARRSVRTLRGEARLLADELAELVGRPVAIAFGGRVRTGDVVLRLGSRDAELGREGYALSVGRAIRIAARTDTGVFYGTRTMLQLLRRGGGAPAGSGRDWPRYPERGLMLDAGRRFFPARWIEERIRELADLKLNYLHLHLSDNQGFRVESETHPEIVSPEHLTKAELRRIVRVAERRHITVVPEIDMPGHMTAALAPHPELQLRNAFGEPAPDRLDVTNPAALRFARELVEEYLPLFPGPYWHGGADEYMAAAEYPLYPRLAEYARGRYGPQANAKDAVHGFVNWLDDLVRSHGKTLRIWHDDLGGGSAVRVHSQPVVEWWTNVSPLSDLAPPTPQELIDGGHRVMNAGWFPTYYVNHPVLGALRPDMQTAYESWEPHEFYGPFVLNEGVRHPPERVAPGEPRNLGSKLHVWNDDPGYETDEETAAGIRPRLRVLAQKTWGSPPLTGSYAEFERLGG
jgi:hexosaminidase